MKDWFQVLGLLPQFSLDLKALEAHYRKAQWIAHPDQSNVFASPLSADINAAYLALKSPLKRAACVLYCKGHWPIPPDPELLEELFHRREHNILPTAEDIQDLYLELSKAFETENYQRAQYVYQRLCYEESRVATTLSSPT